MKNKSYTLILGLLLSSFAAADTNTASPIGEFSRDGEYIKDYYLWKEGGTIHLFYNVGAAAPKQDWQMSGNEKEFGHATTTDLANWKSHPRILRVIPGTWEGEVVSAPSILKQGGLYYMFYTGFDDIRRGYQSIGLATSKDLFKWERYPENPVNIAPDWAKQNPEGWTNFRDANVIKYGDEFLMFTTAKDMDGGGAIALSSSSNLTDWKDLGVAVSTFDNPESPRVFEREGTYYLFASSGKGRVLLKTKDPKADNWEEIPFNWPSPGLWSGWEVVEFKGRMVFSAFLWKSNGNFIRFWDVEWDGDRPKLLY